MEDTRGALLGRNLEQARVGVDGVTVSTEVERSLGSGLVAIRVVGLSEGTGVSVREGTAVGVILTVITMASEVE